MSTVQVPIAPEPSAPTIMQGRRPIRSVRLPTNGISTAAMTFPTTEIHR